MSSDNKITFSVFTKFWKDTPISELGEFVASLGFDAIELPVRPGYQVEPESVGRKLPAAVRELAACGVKIASIAGSTDEVTIAACAEAGVPVIRTMVSVGDDNYLAVEERTRREYDALVPILDKYGVVIGVQNHCDRFVCNAMGLHHLVEDYDPKHVAIVWDVAHNALNGEDPKMALDIVESHLRMVNLKNAYWRRATGPEAENVEWYKYFTTGRAGLASWPCVADELKKRNYSGVICLTAEYTDESSVNRLIAEDIVFAKSLFKTS
jgi:sugar phosphate isomerase/epimerase